VRVDPLHRNHAVERDMTGKDDLTEPTRTEDADHLMARRRITHALHLAVWSVIGVR
jgi:hypothetical protein